MVTGPSVQRDESTKTSIGYDWVSKPSGGRNQSRSRKLHASYTRLFTFGKTASVLPILFSHDRPVDVLDAVADYWWQHICLPSTNYPNSNGRRLHSNYEFMWVLFKDDLSIEEVADPDGLTRLLATNETCLRALINHVGNKPKIQDMLESFRRSRFVKRISESSRIGGRSTWEGRRLFVSQKGFTGLGPGAMPAGDCIVDNY
jgi:hypothetical protein